MKQELIDKLTRREAVIGVVGLGYVGLPLILRFSAVGFRVVGFDIDREKVEKLNKGETYIKHISPISVRQAVESGFTATSDYRMATEWFVDRLQSAVRSQSARNESLWDKAVFLQ